MEEKAEGPKKHLKILVVDDDHAILEVVKIILEEKYEVITITKGDEIDSVIEKSAPNLILTDIWMQGFDGAKKTAILKKNKSTMHIPIIIMSAHNNTEKIARLAGADGFLAKPFNVEGLYSVIQKHLK